jgi:hypothetical protein
MLRIGIESGGILNVHTIYSLDLPELTELVYAGNTTVHRQLLGVARALKKFDEDADRRPSCGPCSHNADGEMRACFVIITTKLTAQSS